MYVFFFFQAEDGIRDKLVTGVQTCALPIYITVPATTYSGSGAPGRSFTTTRESVTPPVIGTCSRRGLPGAKTFWRRCTASCRSESGEWFRYTTVSSPSRRLRAASSVASIVYRACWTQQRGPGMPVRVLVPRADRKSVV